MKRSRKELMSLFFSMLKIGVIGFGGGSALIPVIEKVTVEKGKFLPEKELNKAVVVANVTPGALPVEIVAGVGRYADGMRGLLLCPLLIALPGAFFVVLLSLLMVTADERLLSVIGIVAKVINTYVLFILAKYVVKTVLGFSGKRDRIICGGIVALVFGLSMAGVSSLKILIGAFAVLAVVGIVLQRLGGKNGSASPAVSRASGQPFGSVVQFLKETAVWLLFLVLLTLPALLFYNRAIAFIGNGLLSSIMSFGGGDAYLTVAEGMFVENGYIASDTFFGSLIPVVNALPGSILCKTLTGIGFYYGYFCQGAASVLGALLMALAGFAVSVTASGLTFVVGVNLYEKLERLKVFDIISRYIRPVVAGLLCRVAFNLIKGIIKF